MADGETDDVGETWPTPFTDVVGCRLPVQQAGMGGVTTVDLAVAVADAGALGMLAAAGRSADQVLADVESARSRRAGGGVVGVSFLVPFLDLAALEVAADAAPLVECFYGDPDASVVDRIHEGGAVAVWQVGSPGEASRAADIGCDLVVVQGLEAGGHVRGRTPLLSLLEQVSGVVDVPVVAAGGIGSGRSMAAALDAGAAAVRVGTRFLAAREADVHPDYLAALVGATAADTVVTEAFALGWPDAPHRVLRSCVDASDAAPHGRSPIPPTRDFGGVVAEAALYAGTSVDDVRGRESAAEVVRSLVGEARASGRR